MTIVKENPKIAVAIKLNLVKLDEMKLMTNKFTQHEVKKKTTKNKGILSDSKSFLTIPIAKGNNIIIGTNPTIDVYPPGKYVG